MEGLTDGLRLIQDGGRAGGRTLSGQRLHGGDLCSDLRKSERLKRIYRHQTLREVG